MTETKIKDDFDDFDDIDNIENKNEVLESDTKILPKEKNLQPVKKKDYPKIADELNDTINRIAENLAIKHKCIDWSGFVQYIKTSKDWPPMKIDRSMPDEIIKVKTISNMLHYAFQADGQKAEDFLIISNKYYVGMAPIEFLSIGKVEFVVNTLAKMIGIEPTSVYQ